MSDPVGIVVPAYRPDVDILEQYVQALDRTLDPAAIRIELDAPETGVAADLSHLPATIGTSPDRRGKGAAISAGFDALDTAVLSFADADGSTPASQFHQVVEPVSTGVADIGVGSRRHPDSTVRTSQSRPRAVLGDTFAWTARRALDVQLYDYQCGAKAITADGWERIAPHLAAAGFEWDIWFLALGSAFDLSIREVPIEWRDHPDSTVPPVRTALSLARALVTARRRASEFPEAIRNSVRTGRSVHGRPAHTLASESQGNDD